MRDHQLKDSRCLSLWLQKRSFKMYTMFTHYTQWPQNVSIIFRMRISKNAEFQVGIKSTGNVKKCTQETIRRKVISVPVCVFKIKLFVFKTHIQIIKTSFVHIGIFSTLKHKFFKNFESISCTKLRFLLYICSPVNLLHSLKKRQNRCTLVQISIDRRAQA